MKETATRGVAPRVCGRQISMSSGLPSRFWLNSCSSSCVGVPSTAKVKAVRREGSFAEVKDGMTTVNLGNMK